jgi:hypothetical protein
MILTNIPFFLSIIVVFVLSFAFFYNYIIKLIEFIEPIQINDSGPRFFSLI